jgi:phage shock protein A
MAGFFKKLNTLIQAQINDAIRPLRPDSDSKARRKFLGRVGGDGALSQDVGTLRRRIDDALNHETALEAKVDKLYALIAQLDALADEALAQGREGEARKALAQLQQAQRDLRDTESHLYEHRLVTQELISRVNTLEAVLEQAKRAEAERKANAATAPDAPANETNSEAGEHAADQAETLGQRISAQLDATRERLARAIDQHQPSVPSASKPSPVSPVSPVDNVDDDLAQRRARLMKPPSSGDSDAS